MSPTDQVPSYEFKLGDANTGLQRVRYGERQPRRRGGVNDWLFSFRGRPPADAWRV